MRRLGAAALVLLLSGAIAAGGAWALLQSYLDSPVGGESTILVEGGSTLRPVLNELASRGVLERPAWLYAHARLSGQTAIRTGEYRIAKDQTPRELLAMLMAGRVVTATFTIAEGLNRWQVRDLLAAESWIKPALFDRLCDDRAFLESHRIPGPTCDGYFFPETYTFARGVAGERIFAEVFRVYRRNFEEVTRSGTGPLNFSEREFATLASIIEKETGDPIERPRIACLFYNRLKAKPVWRLQTDPTVIYAAHLEDPSFNGNIKRYHLREMKNPYNTYTNYGLPPGPIASPGRAAMEALVAPAECSDFFFVSMNNGRHVFCPTLACHEAAVQKWQIDYFRRRRR